MPSTLSLEVLSAVDAASKDGPVRDTRVLVIGAGVSGIAAVHALRKAGIADVTVLEGGSEVGGTWRENTYPGCACDVPSLLYSFSFAQNPNWTRVFARQPEIQAYVKQVAADLGIGDVIRTGVIAGPTHWDEEAQRWFVQTTEGTYRAQWVIAATGPLADPLLPSVPGLDAFEGEAFHSAAWNHEYDLTGKRVAVVGTGASGIQIIPEIQPQVGHLTLFQRTPTWVLPRPDRPIRRHERFLLRHVPGLQRLVRTMLLLALEGQQLAQRHPPLMRLVQKLGLWNIRRQIADPELRRAMTPSFTLGCKRLLMSNTFYRALTQPNASVVPHAVREVRPHSIVAADGSEHEVDTIIFATGFHVTDPPVARAVTGRSGVTLADSWGGGGPQAYLGTVAPDIPNAFIMVGPNIGQGHTSVFLAVEAQAGYIADAITTATEAGVEAIEVRRDVHERWNERVQKALRGTVWNAGGCASYYLDASGRNSTIYPWTQLDLMRRMRGFTLTDFHTARAGGRLPEQ